MNLLEAEQKLVTDLRNAGPARWAINATPSATQYIYRIMAAYMMEEVAYAERAEGKACTALVVGPSGNMHRWWDGGWKGAHLSSVAFMRNAAPSFERYDVVCFDRQTEYPQKYLDALGAFLVDHAERALFLLPAEPALELGRVLAVHRFIHINVH